jgi:hypothetical protein
MLIERGMMAELVGGEILEGLEENGSERFLIGLGDFEDLLGSLERFVALRVTDLGENETSGVSGSEADLGGHRGGKLSARDGLNIPKWGNFRRGIWGRWRHGISLSSKRGTTENSEYTDVQWVGQQIEKL